jgi:hypothetical protein
MGRGVTWANKMGKRDAKPLTVIATNRSCPVHLSWLQPYGRGGRRRTEIVNEPTCGAPVKYPDSVHAGTPARCL